MRFVHTSLCMCEWPQQVRLPGGGCLLGKSLTPLVITKVLLCEDAVRHGVNHPCSSPRCHLSIALPLQIGILGPPGQQAPPPYPGQSPATQPVMQQPSTPMFVSPPPKTQRLLHSEAYLKYIEGLSAESNSISKWDQTLAGKVFGTERGVSVWNSLPCNWILVASMENTKLICWLFHNCVRVSVSLKSTDREYMLSVD